MVFVNGVQLIIELKGIKGRKQDKGRVSQKKVAEHS